MENSISQDNTVLTSLKRGGKILDLSAKVWFVVAVIGQWIFAYYVAAFYGGTAIAGNLEAWGEDGPQGIIEGDPVGNVAMAVHVFLAVIIMAGGPLQLIPAVRNWAPKFHRWNGRTYLVTAFIVSIAGLYMIWTRGIMGGMVLYLGNTLDAILIVAFGIMSLRTAMAGKIQIHRKWALRLFMVVSAVWFYRVGLMFWIGINGAMVGFDPETLEGPFTYFLAFAQYLLPLAILELYLRAKERGGTFQKVSVAVLIFVCTLATCFGVFIASVGMWFPSM